MTKKIDWKKELLDSSTFNQKKENLLGNGSKSVTDNWLIGVLYTRWKNLKVFREQPSPDCSSSFQECNKQIEDVVK